MKVNIYYGGKLILTIHGMRSESKEDLLKRVKSELVIGEPYPYGQ